MPAPSIKAFAKKHGKSESEVESLWAKAKKIAKKEYPDRKEGTEEFYKVVMGILKKSMGIKEQTFSADLSKPIPPMANTGRRIMPFKDFVKRNRWRVYWGLGQFRDFSSEELAYKFYEKMQKNHDEPKKPIKIS